MATKLLTPAEVCEILSIKPRTLEDWRLGRSGPSLPFVRLGRTVRYREEDVEALIKESLSMDPTPIQRHR
ncbi:helix-turn-helix domain-containing protein [Frateuria terrea]|uniref:DNA binding domain-containing protein, excisionase family n=2 Tax=Frateuria terrea TaxID=529704 RepID=A0A1H6ZVA9_9GAMM|nr:DNA binding domain-containing protein, excisionase family [Frateuria terrea]SFP47084.1 DNA binding domain-containing protein, excisionase family [Frateuria terrea]